MAWLRLVLLVLVSVTVAGCELAGDILELGAWMGAIAVLLVVGLVALVVAKIRG